MFWPCPQCSNDSNLKPWMPSEEKTENLEINFCSLGCWNHQPFPPKRTSLWREEDTGIVFKLQTETQVSRFSNQPDATLGTLKGDRNRPLQRSKRLVLSLFSRCIIAVLKNKVASKLVMSHQCTVPLFLFLCFQWLFSISAKISGTVPRGDHRHCNAWMPLL